MSDFRRLGPAVVDADRIKMLRPTEPDDLYWGVWVVYADDKEDLVRTGTADEAAAAISQFYGEEEDKEPPK